MKYIAPVFLLIVASAAAADDPPAELDPITVYIEKDRLGSNIEGLRDVIPCLGCDGKRLGPSPMLELGKGLGLFVLSPLFQKVRMRSEPNDEAAYYALRGAECTPDSLGCPDRHPNPGLYNWVPSGNPQDDILLNDANSILQSK